MIGIPVSIIYLIQQNMSCGSSEDTKIDELSIFRAEMKILFWVLLSLTCFTLGQPLNITLSSEVESLVNELRPHQNSIRIAVANSIFGKGSRLNKPQIGLTCKLCRTIMSPLIRWTRQGVPPHAIRFRVIYLCRGLKLLPWDVCEDATDQYLEIVLRILNNRIWLTTVDVCGMLMGGTTDLDCRSVNETMISWSIEVDKKRPPSVDRPYPPQSITPTKVIHLTDIHLDLHYREGSLADCESHLCCRPSVMDNPLNVSISAGPWGDYRDCDQPLQAVETIFHDAAMRHSDAEFIIMSGDLTHHEIWKYTRGDNLAHYNSVFGLFRKEFGNKSIYPVVGNHEPVPCDQFPTRKISTLMPEHDISWVYDALASGFASSLTPSALKTFRSSGYYAILHRPGFRIISLNTNFCYSLNLWLIHSPQDPEGQLQWLSDRLEEAEKNHELVWLIGHVPPGSDNCWYYWGQKYNQLINRYESIIRAQFFGHTHHDEFKIFFDMDEIPPRPTGSLFISTSVTPYSNVNPGYKVFFADGKSDKVRNATWEILDHEVWIYNLTDANPKGTSVKPLMFKEYSAKETYGMMSFRPTDMYALVERMAQDDETFQKYYKFTQMSYDGLEECFTEKCKLEILCPLVQTDYSTANCDRLKKIIQGL